MSDQGFLDSKMISPGNIYASLFTAAFSALEAEGLARFHIFISNVGKREGDC